MNTTRASLLFQLRRKTDSTAWSRFVQIYTPLVNQWVKTLGVQPVDRDDVIQQVFVSLLGKISDFRYDGSKSFRGWLRRITINKCRDLFRRANRKVEPEFMERIELAEASDQDLLTEQEYRSYLVSSALRVMKDCFSETTWRACWLHVAEGRKAGEVAEQLGISENAVYLARGRVLKRLRDELDGLWE